MKQILDHHQLPLRPIYLVDKFLRPQIQGNIPPHIDVRKSTRDRVFFEARQQHLQQFPTRVLEE